MKRCNAPAALEKPAAARIWELDAWRGLCVCLMILDHTLYDIGFLFGDIWQAHPLLQGLAAVGDFACSVYWYSWPRMLVRALVLASFIALCGISCSFSRSNLWRGMRLLVVALLLSLVTWLADRFLGVRDYMTIRFGVLHMLAISILAYHLVHRFHRHIVLAIGMLMIAMGLYFHYHPLPGSWMIGGILGVSPASFYSADYFPLLPWCGYLLAGAALGQRLYQNRRSRFPKGGGRGWQKALCLVGRHALLVYVLHQPILYAFFSLLTHIF
ncbi:MAG: DUF1624 domain-containing protein [Firmicutes bacterium]|nr:DUF1624 domain-containing protein [Bacillota bacterium]